MSQEKVEVVRRAFQAFADQDLDGALADFTEDVEWRLIGGLRRPHGVRIQRSRGSSQLHG